MNEESRIIKEWAGPNWDRINGLVRLDGYSHEEAVQYDQLERRWACLESIAEIRKLDEAERQELKDIDLQLARIDTQVNNRQVHYPQLSRVI